jgi:hypothetical protein
MSFDYRDAKSEKPRRSKNFWTPIWITAIISAGGIAFSVGQYLTEQQWADADQNALAVDSMSSPRFALAEAERQLLDDRIDFAVYRDLLRGALGRADPEVRSAAYQSIHRVLAAGRGCSDALKKELASMPTQVFIRASDQGASAAQDIEQKLKRRDTAVVIQETQNPSNKISKTEVLCYDQEVCKQSGQAVVNLLREDGYDASGPTQKDGTESSYSNRIDVELAELKTAAPVKPVKKAVVVKVKARQHPKAAQPPLVAQEEAGAPIASR